MTESNNVKITGIDVPFWDLLHLLIQLVIAAIPAVIAAWIVYALIGGAVVMVLGGGS